MGATLQPRPRGDVTSCGQARRRWLPLTCLLLRRVSRATLDTACDLVSTSTVIAPPSPRADPSIKRHAKNIKLAEV